jgi:type I restriction enzyme, S subunit
VIFTREAPAGEACLVPETLKVCLGQRTVLMKLKDDLYSSAFLVHMIYAGPPLHRIRLASQGSTVGHFNMDDIANMQVLVPPRAEQVKIVAALEERTAGLDVAIGSAEREIDLIREYRTRLIADVVTGQLDVREAAASLPDIAAEASSDVFEEAEELGDGADRMDDDLDLDESADAAD